MRRETGDRRDMAARVERRGPRARRRRFISEGWSEFWVRTISRIWPLPKGREESHWMCRESGIMNIDNEDKQDNARTRAGKDLHAKGRNLQGFRSEWAVSG